MPENSTAKKIEQEYCPVCGNRIEEDVCCPECGHECLLDQGELYCPVCGPKEPHKASEEKL
ncbi:MAG: hypothetical protein HYS21_11535 [Deltaproteobacteria bacterium]|nr:hypothetical protein [Deltaproteobacteria bacterium]